jgi:hypothetical protein
LKRYKLPGTEQISAEFVQPEGKALCFQVYKLSNFTWNEKQLPEQFSLHPSIILNIKIRGESQQSVTQFISYFMLTFANKRMSLLVLFDK